MTVLIVEDDNDDAEFLISFIKEINESMQCFVVRNGITALTFLDYEEQIPSFIFLDGHLPGMTSTELLVRLRNRPNLVNTKIIMYSGYLSDESIEKFMSLGAHLF